MSNHCHRSGSGRFGYATLILVILSLSAFFTALVPQHSLAQTKVLIDDKMFEIDAKMAIDSLYNRNNSGADALLAGWKQRYPAHPIWHLWDGMEFWWEVLDDLADTSRDEDFKNLMMQADYEAARLLRNEPDHKDALIIRAVANSYIARLYSNREEWVTSLQVGRRGYQAHQRLVEVAPNLPDNLFAEGMKLYYSAYIPEKYPVVRAVSWFLPDGDRQEGIKTLTDASKNAVFARPEAAYFLGTIYLNYEGEFEKAREIYKNLVDSYPDNPYYQRLYFRTLAHLDRYNEILTFFDETIRYRQEHNLPENKVFDAEAFYWYGRAQYFTGRMSDSLASFAKALEIGATLVNHRERDTHTLAALYAGRAAERLQMEEEARNYYRVASNQKAAPDAAKQARQRMRAL